MTNSKNLIGKIPVTLFLLVFAVGFTLGGTALGVLPMYKQLSGWWQAISYAPVPARVLNAELKSYSGKSVTYRAEGQFAYEYQGRTYLSNRVNLSGGKSDNISSYQQDIYQQLIQARNNYSTVTVWVNPRQPDQAIYDRTIRWTMIIFLIPFAVLFPAVGLGAWWMIWRLWHTGEAQEPVAIALANRHTSPGPLGTLMIQGDGGGLIALLFFGGFWNILSWPIAIVFLSSANAAPWWVPLLVSVFPAIGLVFIVMFLKTWRAQWRIGKPVLALTATGVPGSVPLQGQILFNPALGTRLDSSKLTHTVSVNLEYIRETRRGEDTSHTVLWHGQALQADFARGTQSLNFKIDLPENLPVAVSAASGLIREYWQVVLKSLDSEVKFIVPVHAASVTRSSVKYDIQAQTSDNVDVKAIRLASRMRWIVKTLIFFGIAYFIWDLLSNFALPMYQSWQNNSNAGALSTMATVQAEKSQLPRIHAPFLLDSFSGNGFGVVARVVGKMEIGDNTLLILPESIELRSFGNCSSDCPLVHSVEFSLTRDGSKSFSVLSQSVLIPVRENLTNAMNLKVSLPHDQPPILLTFADREQLATLRLTLEINGRIKNEEKIQDASWYTHAEPFAAALGKESARLETETDSGSRRIQAQQAVSDGRTADLERLLQAGIDTNIRDAQGQTMLMRAASRGDLSIVQLLLAHGAQVNATTAIDKDGNGALTALHAALVQDAVNVVEALIKSGANPQAEVNRVWTPMHYAAYLGAEKSVRYLHKNGINIDKPFNGGRGSTPLMVAAEYAQVPTIRALLELGADPERKDLYGENACGYARFFRKAASIAALGCN